MIEPTADAVAEELPDFLWTADDQTVRQPLRRPTKAVRKSDKHIPGEIGLWIFILGDMTLFGLILLVFLWCRRADESGFKESAAQLIQPIGAVNTLVLLLSSYLVVRAVFALRSGRGQTARRLVLGSMACAAAFAGLKAVEYFFEVSQGHTPSAGLFFTFYFVLTGLHLLHVVVGSGLLYVWTQILRKGTTWPSSSRLVEGIASYWHMVDLLWIAIFTPLYLVCAE